MAENWLEALSYAEVMNDWGENSCSEDAR